MKFHPEICIECQNAGFCVFQEQCHQQKVDIPRNCFLFRYDPPEKDQLNWVDQFEPWWTNPMFYKGQRKKIKKEFDDILEGR